MYNNLQIFKTDFSDKYLVLHNDKSLYVGVLIKEIIELLKDEKSSEFIANTLTIKYNQTFEKEIIESIVSEKINPMFCDTNNTSLIKFFVICNPNKINALPVFNFLFSKYLYYITLFLVFVSSAAFVIFIKDKTPLNLSNQIFLFIVLLFILFFHEIGHVISAKRFDIGVPEIGFGVYFIFPVFYVNLNESWRLDRFKRTIINLSGIYFQLIINVCLILLYAIFKNSLFYELIKLNFLIVLINLNPFIKFDGYWILSDLLNIKDLNKSSNEVLKKVLRLNIKEVHKGLLLYGILKAIFYTYIFYQIFLYLKNLISKITGNREWEDTDALILIFFIAIFVKILLKLKK